MYFSCSAAIEVRSGATGALVLPRGERRLTGLVERELTLGVDTNDDVITLREAPLEHCHRQRVLEQPLDSALQWARTKRGIVSFGGEDLSRLPSQLQTELPV